MIYCIWYPTGGFGHFINAILSCYGENFIRPVRTPEINIRGAAHHLDMVLPQYQHEPNYQLPKLDPTKNYSVLIDNGISNESEKFKQVFSPCNIIKMCYNDYSWPIIAKRYIVAAMKKPLAQALPVDNNWPSDEAWAVREKYFLYLTQNPFKNAWNQDLCCINIDLLDIVNYDVLQQKLLANNIVCHDFKELHIAMMEKNQVYFSGVDAAQKTITAIKTNKHIDLAHITDLWDQAIINYYVQLEFGVEIPANDYANWFSNSQEIVKLL